MSGSSKTHQHAIRTVTLLLCVGAKSAQKVFSRVASPAMALIMQYISVFELCTHQVYTSTRFRDAVRESLKLERCVTVLWFSDVAKV